MLLSRLPRVFSKALLGALVLGSVSNAHASTLLSLSLEQAIELAFSQHPSVRAESANVEISQAQVKEARAAMLPDMTFTTFLNRSTVNAAAGMVYLPIGQRAHGFGTVAGGRNEQSFTNDTWQSGVGVFAMWNLTALPRHSARIDAALAMQRGAEELRNARKLDIAFQTSDTFLGVLAAQELVKSADAAVERATLVARIVRSLVTQDLRPGVDASRADAEIANAQTQKIRAEQLLAVRRAQLGEAIGKGGSLVDASAGGLMAPIEQEPFLQKPEERNHPLVRERIATIDRGLAIKRSIEYEYLPRIDIVSGLFFRGTGLQTGGASMGGWKGIVPEIPNWVVGFIATVPLTGYPSIAARAQAARASVDLALARRDELVLAISGQWQAALAAYQGARRIAQNTVITIGAARAAFSQASARYRARLATLTEVADAQRVLAVAELDDVLARIEERRTFLWLARSSGNLTPLIRLAKRSNVPFTPTPPSVIGAQSEAVTNSKITTP